MPWRIQIELVLNNNKATFCWNLKATLLFSLLRCFENLQYVFAGLPSTGFSCCLSDAIYTLFICISLVEEHPEK